MWFVEERGEAQGTDGSTHGTQSLREGEDVERGGRRQCRGRLEGDISGRPGLKIIDQTVKAGEKGDVWPRPCHVRLDSPSVGGAVGVPQTLSARKGCR